MFTKESLEKLKDRVDLVEVISSHVQLKRMGRAYKALCPFHQERTPSFVVQKGDSHYHCFGCMAHGDAIQFLMHYLNISFVEAVESLAERYHVILERQDSPQDSSPSKSTLKEAAQLAAHYFHNCLLYTEEGKEALAYLYKRGITLDFIRRFELGFAPADVRGLLKMMQAAKIEESYLIEAGLLTESGRRAFFKERIIFPIFSAIGSVIGFSARKIKEESFGGKYINTAETALFKKSRVLFGLNHSRRRIAQERRVIIVEGQIDCLKMIESGLNLTVASLGTAFGEGHADELKKLQIRMAYLLFDGDAAGQTAASKVGDSLQKRGIDVHVVTLPEKYDPDSYLSHFGMPKLIEQLEGAQGYLEFQIAHLSRELSVDSPAGKAELVKSLKKQIELWEDPVLVHESLRKVAALVHVPEETLGIKGGAVKESVIERARLQSRTVDTNRVLEVDLLRWLVLKGESFLPTARHYLDSKHFFTPVCRFLFETIVQEGKTDLFTLASCIQDQTLIDEIVHKKVNSEKAEQLFLETVQKLLDRNWLQRRESIRIKIHNGGLSESEILSLAKEFDQLKSARPIADFKKLSSQ